MLEDRGAGHDGSGELGRGALPEWRVDGWLTGPQPDVNDTGMRGGDVSVQLGGEDGQGEARLTRRPEQTCPTDSSNQEGATLRL